MMKKLIYPCVAFVVSFFVHAVYSLWGITEISKQWVQIQETPLFVQYLQRQEYFLSFAYALAAAFIIYALVSFLQNRKSGIAGVLGGITFTGVLYFAGCFLLGCCGSPMLAVYLSLFGSSFLGFTKPLTAILTLASVIFGYFWMERKAKTLACCAAGESCNGSTTINNENAPMNHSTENDIEALSAILFELSNGMELPKCRKCGCMKETLESLQNTLSSQQMKSASELLVEIEAWHKKMEPIKYACLGCEYCFAAVTMNIFNEAYSTTNIVKQLECSFENKDKIWPAIAGEYFAFCDGADCPVAVSTLGDVELAERLAKIRPKELCIVGKTETENIGIDKVIKNTIMNQTIRFLVIAGQEPEGHHSGNTFLALSRNGVDASMKVIGSTGKRPVLRNVTLDEVKAFRKQVQIIDMIGCSNETSIVEKLRELSQQPKSSYEFEERAGESKQIEILNVPVIEAKEPKKIEMDKTGYFVILPHPERKTITVEYYSYNDTLQRIIKGKDARGIYWTIIENKFVTQLSHAAYLGKELTRAELSMTLGFKYVQDGA